MESAAAGRTIFIEFIILKIDNFVHTPRLGPRFFQINFYGIIHLIKT